MSDDRSGPVDAHFPLEQGNPRLLVSDAANLGHHDIDRQSADSSHLNVRGGAVASAAIWGHDGIDWYLV